MKAVTVVEVLGNTAVKVQDKTGNAGNTIVKVLGNTTDEAVKTIEQSTSGQYCRKVTCYTAVKVLGNTAINY